VVCGIPKQPKIVAMQTARQGFRLAAQAHVSQTEQARIKRKGYINDRYI